MSEKDKPIEQKLFTWEGWDEMDPATYNDASLVSEKKFSLQEYFGLNTIS